MNSEILIPGMKFARTHNLTPKEIEVLIPFLEKPYTISDLSKLLGINKTTLHHTIQRLKLKNLLILKNRDAKGTNLNEFNYRGELNQKEDIKMEGEESKTEETEKSEDSEEEKKEEKSE